MRLLTRGRSAGHRSVLTLSPMQRRDLPQVLRIEQVAYPSPWSADVFRGEITRAANGDGDYLVARRDGDVVGYGGVMYVLDDAHVTTLVTAPTVRRTGLGTRLLAELCWRAVTHGSAALTLEVRAGNAAAKSLYERFGFEAAGVRRRYYENTEDAIIMWRHAIGSPEFATMLRDRCPEAAR